MIKILEVNPNTNDAMSFYRGRGPLQALQKKYSKEIEFFPMGSTINTNWDFLNIFDAVFILRPYEEQHLNLINICNQFGIKTWVDYDDLLTDVPVDNPAHVHYRGESTKKTIHAILNNCTVATFATKHLWETMGKDVKQKSYVVPNAHNGKILRTPVSFEEHPKVVWRGSTTHTRDLQQFEGPIREAMRGQEGWIIEFMGVNPVHITDYCEALYTPYMAKNTYFRYLTEIKGSINIVPLSHRSEDINFNKAKSNIAWLESSYAGMVSLAPDWEEWRRPGVVNYQNQKDFFNKLTAMMKGKIDLKSLHEASWQYIQSELTLDKINETRYNIIQSHLMPD